MRTVQIADAASAKISSRVRKFTPWQSTSVHRRRDEDLVKTLCPQMRVVPKFSKLYWLSNETSLEKIGRGLFVPLFYPVYRAKSGIFLVFKVIKTQNSPNSIKTPKISIHLRLTIYFCDHFKVRKQWLQVE
jgi:hypothetical protein